MAKKKKELQDNKKKKREGKWESDKNRDNIMNG